MAKWTGMIGFGISTETSPGVFTDVITEYPYFGDQVRKARSLQTNPQQVNPDITVDASISVMGDEFLNEHFFAIRYVRWAGTLWTVENVEVQRPRLILRLGGVYNGQTPGPSENSGGGSGD